jgi:hypothetical protein
MADVQTIILQTEIATPLMNSNFRSAQVFLSSQPYPSRDRDLDGRTAECFINERLSFISEVLVRVSRRCLAANRALQRYEC